MPTQLEVYGCPNCFVNFEWNKANEEPDYCPSCGEPLQSRVGLLQPMLEQPQDERLTNAPLAQASSKGSFAIGGFSRG